MDRIQFGNLLIENVKAISWQEWTSTFFQLISVRFAQKNNIWVYPTGIIGVALAVYLYLFVSHPPLYADGLLNVYFMVMSVYGWWCWSKKKIMIPFISFLTAHETNGLLESVFF